MSIPDRCPTASIMSIENPEAFAEIVCLAPGENQKPLYITHFEVIFPMVLSADKLTYQKYFTVKC